jgi:hypothetical protein
VIIEIAESSSMLLKSSHLFHRKNLSALVAKTSANNL